MHTDSQNTAPATKSKRSVAWTSVGFACFSLGVLTTLGLLASTLGLAMITGQAFLLSDALWPALALGLYTLAGITAMRLGPKLTQKKQRSDAENTKTRERELTHGH